MQRQCSTAAIPTVAIDQANVSLFPRLGCARTFSVSSCLGKKGGKAAREEKSAAKDSDVVDQDPFDFSTLEADLANIIERLKNDLSKLRAGGRFNPEVVENLRVQPEKNSNQTVKVSDLAQTIPKGRTVQILVGEKDVRPLPYPFMEDTC